jgi:protein O-mannosyl-transferase
MTDHPAVSPHPVAPLVEAAAPPRRWWPYVAVFIVAAAMYVPSLWNGFAYDDHAIIRLDDRVHDLGSVGRLLTEPYWRDSDLGLYRPLASISYALDWAVSGDSAAWFHAINILWNAAVCVLVFALLAAFVPLAPAAAGALIFAVHPVHVEAVANIVGRAEVMAAFFVLLAMVLWSRMPADTRVEPRRLAVLALCYALALLSKESAIMLPALLALVDVARGTLRPDSAGDWLRRHARVIGVLGVVAVVYLLVRTAVIGELGPGRVDPALDLADYSGARILTALQGWPFIMRLLLFPRVLLSDYGPRVIMPTTSWTPAAVLGGIILGGLVAGGVVAWLRGRGRLAFALLFLPVAFLPVSNLIIPIGVIVAERALYLPSLALAAGVAFAAAAVPSRPVPRLAFGTALLIAVVLFAARSAVRIPEWRSTASVFAALRRDRPDSFRAQWHNARVAANQEDMPLALSRYAQALNTWPYRRNVVVEAANVAASAGDLEFARTIADHGLTQWPDNVILLRLRAGIALDQADTATAVRILERGLTLAPDDSVMRLMRDATTRGR